MLSEQKTIVRKSLQKQIRAVSMEERRACSEAAWQLLQAQEVWQRARCVLLYSPLPDELDLWPLVAVAITGGKQVAIPRYRSETDSYEAAVVTLDPSTRVLGKFGILEAAPACLIMPIKSLDLALVPGVGLDMNGRRLGRGKGYYDRFLGLAPCLKCGVGYDFQVLPEVPAEPHDLILDSILTPTRWIKLNRARF